MKIQRPSYEIWLQKPGELGIYQQIERAGRVCYKSENNTTVNSAKPFVDRMVQSEHFAMLEHGTVYLVCKHGELPLYPPTAMIPPMVSEPVSPMNTWAG